MVIDEAAAEADLLPVVQTQWSTARPHSGHRRPDAVEYTGREFFTLT
jgi:hypothetical protein